LQNDHFSVAGETVGDAVDVEVGVGVEGVGEGAVGSVDGDAVGDEIIEVGEGAPVGADGAPSPASFDQRESAIRTIPTTNRTGSAHSHRPDAFTFPPAHHADVIDLPHVPRSRSTVS
jgi:hypothetical protein